MFACPLQTLLPGKSTYDSVNNNELLDIPHAKELDTLLKDFQKCCLQNKKETSYSSNTDHIIKLNFHIECIFKSFLNGILLKNIPGSLKLYPDKQVISCDVAGVIQRALSIEENQSSPGPGSSSSHCQGRNEALTILFGERKKFIEQVIEAPTFADFLIRHGFALHFFQRMPTAHTNALNINTN